MTRTKAKTNINASALAAIYGEKRRAYYHKIKAHKARGYERGVPLNRDIWDLKLPHQYYTPTKPKTKPKPKPKGKAGVWVETRTGKPVKTLDELKQIKELKDQVEVLKSRMTRKDVTIKILKRKIEKLKNPVEKKKKEDHDKNFYLDNPDFLEIV